MKKDATGSSGTVPAENPHPGDNGRVVLSQGGLAYLAGPPKKTIFFSDQIKYAHCDNAQKEWT